VTRTCLRWTPARLLAQARSGAWLDGARARDYALALGPLYFAGCLGLMLWSGAAAAGASDFTSFYAAGRQALADPAAVYAAAAHHAMETAVTGNPGLGYSYFFYPPVLLLLCAPLAILPYGAAYAVWGALQLGAYAWALRRLVGPTATIAPYLAFPAGLLALAMGQNAMFTAALFAASTAALLSGRREATAGVLFGLLCYKPHFGLLVPVALVAGRHWRAVVAAAATVAGLAGLSGALFGLDTWSAYVAAFLHATEGVYGTTRGGGTANGTSVLAWWLISPFGLALSLGASRGVALAVQAAAALASAVLVFRIWRRPAAAAAKAAALVAGTMLSVPVILYYDSLPLAVCLAWTAVEARRSGWLPWEKSLYLAAYAVALAAGLLRDLVHLPLLLAFTPAVLALAWRRAAPAAKPR
jgi:hypothetical protein